MVDYVWYPRLRFLKTHIMFLSFLSRSLSLFGILLSPFMKNIKQNVSKKCHYLKHLKVSLTRQYTLGWWLYNFWRWEHLSNVHMILFLQLSQTTRAGVSHSAVALYFMGKIREPQGLRMEPSQTQGRPVFTSGGCHLETSAWDCAWYLCCCQKFIVNSSLYAS